MNNNQEIEAAQTLPLEQQVEQTFQLEIVKVIPNPDEAIASLKEKYLSLKATDRASFKKVEEARKDVKNVRIAGEKVCDVHRDLLEKEKKVWINKKKEWAEVTGEVESYLEGEATQFKEAEQKKKDDEARRLEEERQRLDKRLLVRQQELGQMSVLFADNTFMLGDMRYSYEQLREADDEMYANEILPAFTAIFEQHEQERAQEEQQRRDAEEKQRQEAEKLKQEQEAFKRQQEELLQQRFELRRDRLLELGLVAMNGQFMYNANLYVNEVVVRDAPNEDFADVYNEISDKISSDKKYQEELKERERIAEELSRKKAERGGQLYNLGLLYSQADNSYIFEDVNVHTVELTTMTDDEWTALIKKITPVIADRKAEAERKIQEEEDRQRMEQEKKAIGLSRYNTLKSLDVDGWEQEVLSEMSDADWESELKEAKDVYDKKRHEEWLEQEKIKEQQAKEREAQRLAELSENKRWKEWVEKKLIPFMADIPAFETKRYARARKIATEKIEEIIILKPGNF